MKKRIPFVSIIVIAYNEEKTINLAINSLLNQTYPQNKYEIIVVDDCSKDQTAEIVKRFPVRLIQHKKNLGRAQARNTGLKYARGEIYIGFDADCIAQENWLDEIIRVYLTQKSILGVGGEIIVQDSKKLVDRFVQEKKYGNPLPLYMFESKNKNILSRFFSFLKFEFQCSLGSNQQNSNIIVVGEIMGANSSFYVDNLKEIGGWDINLNAKEDTDLCYRLKDKFHDKKFYVNKKARIVHNHHLNLFEYLKTPFLRGIYVVKFYKKQKKFLPLPPFPIIILCLSLISSLYFGGLTIPLSLLVLPQFFYFWNGINFIKKLKCYYLIFPYIQFILEIFSILGLFRGLFLLKIKSFSNRKGIHF